MENNFNSRGVYVISIKKLKPGEKLYLDKEYEYDIYYYSSKKEYSRVKGKLIEDYLKTNCKNLLPTPAENIKYLDFENYKLIDKSNILKHSPSLKNKNFDEKKFYCIILDGIDVDDLVFFGKEYNQKVYEFEKKEELDEFINGNKKDREPKQILKSTLESRKQENRIYLLANDNKQKVLKKEFILNPEDFDVEDYTIVVLWPSMDTYVFNCHEDYVNHVIIFEGELIKKEMEVKKFIDYVEEFYNEETRSSKDLKCQYVGKTSNFDFDYEESRILVSNYLRFDFISNKEKLDYLTYLRAMEKTLNLTEKIKANPEESISEARELLITMRIIDEFGNILSPFDKIIFKDDSLKNKNNSKSKTRKPKK